MAGKEHRFTSPVALFALLMPALREAAKECGYALGLHGSMQRDLDLIACPWVQDAKSPAELVEALQRSCDGYWAGAEIDDHEGWRWDRFICPVDGKKPHGRLTAAIYFTRGDWNQGRCGEPYIDLSIMPRLTPQREPIQDLLRT